MKLFLTFIFSITLLIPSYAAKTPTDKGCVVIDSISILDGYIEGTTNPTQLIQFKITNNSSKNIICIYGLYKLTLIKDYVKSYKVIKTILYQGSIFPKDFIWQDDGWVVDNNEEGKVIKCTISIKAVDYRDIKGTVQKN
jgi:hypothetical protein